MFLLSLVTYPVGLDWYLVVFLTVLQFFVLWFVICSLSCLLFPYFAVGLRCYWMPSLRFLNVLVVALVFLLIGCLFHLRWSCALDVILPV